MIDCALMGVDWTRLTFGTYAALLAEWNERHPDPNARKQVDVEFMTGILEAHGAR